MKVREFTKILRCGLACTAFLGVGLAGGLAFAHGPVPAKIKIGTLYASSGPFSAISMPVYKGLKLWVREMNAQGGVYVKPYGKKIRVKLVAYDDLSSTSTATNLYNQLITQDKVNILVADSGSVLTSVAVPLAREHKMLLFDQTGTGPNFFSNDNKYIALLDDPVSSIWPRRLAEFLTNVAAKRGIHRVAIIYSTNDFTGAQAKWVHDYLKVGKGTTKVVYYHGVPTSTTNYAVLLHRMAAAHPDAVLEFGYPNNDISFFRALYASGIKFPMIFAIYPGLETQLMEKNAGVQAIINDFTYIPASDVKYKASFGMDIRAFRAAYQQQYGTNSNVGFNAVAGYNTGLIIQKALNTTKSMNQMALRKAVFSLSGKLVTLDGAFKLTPNGAQKGELMPVGQIQAEGKGISLLPVYPADFATAKPVWGAHG